MKTVKAKIKGTNAILEGCVCDDSFFVSVDHDIFERYALCEVEICKDSLQVPETCKENQDSFTSLEEAADDYADKHGFRVPYDGSNNYYDDVDVKASKEGFIAGAEWQKDQMELYGSVTLTESDFDAEKEKASGWGYNLCKEQMMNRAVDGEIGYWNQTGLSIRLDQSLEKIGYDEDTKVKIIIVKQDDRPRD